MANMEALLASHHAALKTGDGLIASLVALAALNNTKGRTG